MRALIDVPLVERGRLVGVMFVHEDRARTWSAEEVAFAEGVADRTYAALAKIQVEERQDVLNHELSHRLKNTLAMVLSIAGQTLRAVPDRAPIEAFERRVQALASAHDLLLHGSWAEALLRDVAGAVLGNFADDGRITLRGPDIALGPRATLSASLLMHELATNAVKYGSLSVEAGRVEIAWTIEDDVSAPELVVPWRESGGPPAAARSRPDAPRVRFAADPARPRWNGSGGDELSHVGS